MNEVPQLPEDFCEGYWNAVVEELLEQGMKQPEAEKAVAGYREFMKRASWTIYNDQVTESARMAKVWLKNWGGKKSVQTPLDANGPLASEPITNGAAKSQLATQRDKPIEITNGTKKPRRKMPPKSKR